MNSHKTDPDNAEETCSNNTVERQTDVESICTEDINTKKEPYTVFSTQQQIIIVIITAFTAMISPLTANIYLPALNQIEESLQINTEQVNLTVTVYMIFQALSPTFWGTLADSLGRRPILMYTMIVYCGACVGLALTPNYAALIVFRMLQAFGSSPVIAVGAGIIGDIADSRKRGSYFGVYSIGQLSGPVYGPVIGGIISEKLSWQWIFWILLILGATSLVLVGLFSPETLRSLVGNGSGYANPTIWQWLARRRGKLDERAIQRIKDGRIRPRMNFLKPFSYLLQPDVFTVLLYNGLHYAAYYCFLSSTTKQFSIHYPYLSELEIGLCFLCQGSGTIIGSFTRGQMLDRDYKKTKDQFKQKHPDKPDSDFPIFKARFKTLWPNIVLCQIVTLFYGWSLYWGAPLAVALVLQFLVGFGATGIMTTTQTLLIDLHPGKGASITASNNLVRCILGGHQLLR
ncbi:hypothetical protein G6F64_001782 [Rhizopus arrhizus]|uniref:Major facilitator superfamily (MFS) profile domain-containing protein n=1 Tax=Rhizopus oryzae TaxID=64495 RepID=A0A9P7BWH8_RHIOR|nr:hypothetical protein G6F64_001782 [Rhizopus arrhizus]